MYTLTSIVGLLPDQISSANFLAYLDPGAGSMLLQVLIAGVFSSIFFAKSSLTYVRDALLAKKKKI
ncbi:MAG: hypothetical protein ABS79_07075 [Planctomycetes bacterium SCN 63-9]|nr:MAG: hypothetical protein ABS79_07075 [Planctomycetes bacterium SCN 63-9]